MLKFYFCQLRTQILLVDTLGFLFTSLLFLIIHNLHLICGLAMAYYTDQVIIPGGDC